MISPDTFTDGRQRGIIGARDIPPPTRERGRGRHGEVGVTGGEALREPADLAFTLEARLVMRGARITADLAFSIVSGVREGMTMKAAAKRVGLSRETVSRWLRAGEVSKREPYKSFAAAYRAAEAGYRASCVDEIAARMAAM